MGKRRIHPDEINVPAYAHDVPGGYPVYVQIAPALGWDLVVHVFGPHMPSPRPRVTRYGTFMPAEYREHCNMLGASLAYARGMLEAENKRWDSAASMRLDLALWGEWQLGDLDNLAKTVMDAGQLHKGKEPGAELWRNDRQIRSLSVDWIDTEDDAAWCQLVVRVRMLSSRRPASMPIAGPEMARKRIEEEKTGDATPKRRKAVKTAKERQQ